MYRKRLAALIMTGCLLTSAGCSSTSSSTGSGLFGLGLFSGCCGHGSSSGGIGRMFGSGSAPAVASAPMVGGAYAGGYGGADCPCSNHGGSDGVYHPAVFSPGMAGAPAASGGVVMGDMNLPPSFPTQQFQGQPIPVTTPGVPPSMNQPYMPGPVPGSVPAPGQQPRIQPVPQAPNTGLAPSAGFAPPQNWLPQH